MYIYVCWGGEVSIVIFYRIAKEDVNENMSKYVTDERKVSMKIFTELST